MPESTPDQTLDPTRSRLLPPAFKPVRREIKSNADVAGLIARWKTDDPQFAGEIASQVAPALALDRLGIRLCLVERLADAREVLEAALRLSPESISVLNNLAVVCERSGQSVHAIRHVEQSLARKPDQLDSWIFLGNLKQSQGDLPGAAAALETALGHNPNSAIAWQGLALIRQLQRQYTAAIECLRNCIRLNYVSAALLSILGQLFYSTGQFALSRDAYASALEMEPAHRISRKMLRDMRFVCQMIDAENIESALNTYLIDHAGFTIEQDTDQLLHKTYALLSAYGHLDAATIVAEKRLALFPDSASAAYFVHAIQSDPQISRAPDQYIAETFDQMAERFDQHLTQSLGYDLPKELCGLLKKYLPAEGRFDLLDAGCGTGLCGPYLIDVAATLSGVDLSSKMLAQASRRGLYDSLICSEVTAFLAASASQFDAMIAADVLIYFGDLSAFAAAAALSLRGGGLLAFSTESADSPGYHLLASGRFSHHPDYIGRVFEADFIQSHMEQTIVRTEAEQAVPGNLFVFRKRSLHR